MSAQPSKKVVILDSIQAKKIINQLVQGDIAKAENKILKQMDSVSQKRIDKLKDANFNLVKAYDQKVSESLELKNAIEVQNKIINKEKNKKNFYKITTYLSLTSLAILFITK